MPRSRLQSQRFLLAVALLSVVTCSGLAQDAGSQAVTAQGAAKSGVVEENADVRVVRINASAASENIGAENRDVVFVALSESTIRSGSSEPLTLKRGEARFIERGTKYAAAGSAIVVELKHHWERPAKYCEAPANCTRETKMGDHLVSSTTSIFTNGFVTALRYKVVPNGSLDASYYSAKGKDVGILVALTPLSVHFGGTEEHLRADQAYVTTESQVSVDAGSDGAEWVVVRLNQPKQVP